jgi:hypothetical protein
VPELSSISNYNNIDPLIDTSYFPDVRSIPWWSRDLEQEMYWSSSSFAGRSDDAWWISFTNTGQIYPGPKNSENKIRLVRGGQTLPSALPIPIRVTNPLGLWVRSGPGTQYGILNELDDTQEFVAFDKSVQDDNTWYRIWLPCGNTGGASGDCSGWIAGRSQGKTFAVEAPTSTQVEVAGTGSLGLNIRATPNGTVLDSAYDGQRFVSFESRFVAGSGCMGDWHRIHLPTSSYATSGWVCGDFAQLVGSVTPGTLQGQVTRGGAALSGVSLSPRRCRDGERDEWR